MRAADRRYGVLRSDYSFGTGLHGHLHDDDGELRFGAGEDFLGGLMTSDDCLVFDGAEGEAYAEVRRESGPCPQARAVCKVKAGKIRF